MRYLGVCFFVFKQKTAYEMRISDWSSDVCSSDLAALDKAFAELTEGSAPAPDSIHFKGRVIPVPLAARGGARFTFADLCEQPLGPGDYLAIAGLYHTLVLSGVPVLSADKRNEARRFMTLIDALYERSGEHTPELQ